MSGSLRIFTPRLFTLWIAANLLLAMTMLLIGMDLLSTGWHDFTSSRGPLAFGDWLQQNLTALPEMLSNRTSAREIGSYAVFQEHSIIANGLRLILGGALTITGIDGLAVTIGSGLRRTVFVKQ